MLNPNLKKQLEVISTKLRMEIMNEVHAAKCGHPGGSLSIADLMTYLYFEAMDVDPSDPKKPDRDRFVLSKGHTCPALYAALAYRGFFPTQELIQLRKLGALLQGHPDMKSIPGVDMSTGSLGQGISTAVGMALAGKMDGALWNVYTVCGDGEIQEGQVWEAAMLAGHHNLEHLCVIVDNNGLQIDGAIEEVNSPYPIDKKFEAFGFYVQVIDGHNFEEIAEAINNFKANKGCPSAIIMKTVKGKGVSFMENQASWHGVAPNTEQYEAGMAELKAHLAELEN